MEDSLNKVIQIYLADTQYQEELQELVAGRNKTLPQIQPIVYDFVQKKITIHELRQKLDVPRQLMGSWWAQGPGFMMELNKFSKYHNDTTSAPEAQFREILTGLDAQNVGQRIERLYNFLLDERQRLRREGKESNKLVAPRNSAFIISLFAFWLNPTAEPPICKDAARKGYYLLVKSNLLPSPSELQVNNDTIEVISEASYKAYQEILTTLITLAPELKINVYWSECFGYWLRDHFGTLSESASTLIKETDESALLAAAPTTSPPQVSDPQESYAFTGPLAAEVGAVRSEAVLRNDPLAPTPEPLLKRLIAEVQRYILVDETIIRRIYHALLAGHVILTGPPGTGKTELARIIPETLWKSEVTSLTQNDQLTEAELTTTSAYTTRLVTATDEWSVRTLISGLAPISENGSVSYKMQYGYLTSTILRNWSFQGSRPEEWSNLTLRRKQVSSSSGIERGRQQQFRGQWLVIDEFNRAPIDLALGDALTALGGYDVLRVAIEGGSAELPIPQDFRLIGTLNSFDRSYLNQVSEALKRRFSFIEVPPPTRAMRRAEQGIVLYKALQKIRHLSGDSIDIDEEGNLSWSDIVAISLEPDGHYTLAWEDEQHPFRRAFDAAWHLFEVIRIYRQLGTAQAIALLRAMLIPGILQSYQTFKQWTEQALDSALCDTVADQLQVLLPTEIETLLLYLTTEQTAFSQAYNDLLARLSSTPDLLSRQLLALGSVSNEEGQPFLADEQIERIISQEYPEVPPATLAQLFHLEQTGSKLPQFTRRLRLLKAERGL